MSLVLGVGGRPAAPAAELRDLVERVLAASGLRPGDISLVATLDRRAGEPAVRSLAAELGAELAAYSSKELAAQRVPHPSEVVRRHTGLAGVAEAAVLASRAELLVPRHSAGAWTVALGRHCDPAAERRWGSHAR